MRVVASGRASGEMGGGGPDRYWDINCFRLPATNTRGNAPRNSVIGPGLVSVDVSLIKSVALGAELVF